MQSEQRKSLCPSRYCNGHNPAQTLVTERQAALANEQAIAGAILCSDCGCVWVRGAKGKAHALGRLRRARSTYNWVSAYEPPIAERPSIEGQDCKAPLVS